MGGRGANSTINYKNLSLGEYIKNKGKAKYEIAWNKKKLSQIDNTKSIKDDPTGALAEKYINNIKKWKNKSKVI